MTQQSTELETAQGDAVDISVIIVGWNTRDILKACLRSIYMETTGISYEIIYVDNASSDGSLDMVKDCFPSIRYISNEENLGFVKANNQAIEIARGRYVLLLNSDTIVLDNAIARTVGFADTRPDAAVFGCRVVNPDMSLQRSCFMYPSLLNGLLFSSYMYKLLPRSPFFGRQHMTWWEFDSVREVETVSGCFSLVRRTAIEATGAMDPVFFFYGDDLDWCFRFHQAGWKILFYPAATIVHYGGLSTKKKRSEFILQLYGSDMLFMRLHRSGFSFMIYRALSAFSFVIRLPGWAVKGIIDRDSRDEALLYMKAYSRAALLSLADWTRLLMNPTEVAARLGRFAK